MVSFHAFAAAMAVVTIGTGCGSPSPPLSAAQVASDAASPDPDPAFTAQQWAELLRLAPSPLPPPPSDATNRFADDPKAAAFGQQIFYDSSFSGPLLDSDNNGGPGSLGSVGQAGRVACAGCHVPDGAFSDTRSFQLQISLGTGWGRRRAPSLLDVGQSRVLMWDGRRDALYNQIFGPLESVVEMNSSRLYMAEQLFRKYRTVYEAIFGAMPPFDDATRFPQLGDQLTGCQPQNPRDPQPNCNGAFHGIPGDQAEFDHLTAGDQAAVTTVVANAGKAIGAFERLLTCGPTPFDAWMHGNPHAVSRSAQRGAALFVGRGACVPCHGGPFLSDEQFHNVGLKPDTVQQAFVDSNDLGAATGIASALTDPLNSRGVYSDGNDGRLPLMVTSAMTGSFRTPKLRCVATRPTFMHTGQIDAIEGVVTFFNNGGSAGGFPGVREVHALNLTPIEQGDLVAFLRTLTGPGADPNLTHSP